MVTNSVSGYSTVNKEGYITDLQSLKVSTDSEINDLKKAKLLMKSIRKTNPNSAHGWISSAWIEEMDGNIEEARSIIAQACDWFPTHEGVWIEASRLAP